MRDKIQIIVTQAMAGTKDITVAIDELLLLTTVNEWKNILNELPKQEQEVIVYFKNKVGWQTTSCHWDGKNFISLCDYCGHREVFTCSTPITHWQELPNAPK